MSNAVIGALRVTLGLDTAQYSAGLKASQTQLAGFARMASGIGVGLAAAAATAAAGIAYAVKQSADHADALGKTAQKAGVTVEALSRLEWGAKLSDVSLEQLSGGLGKLSKNLLDVASGGGDKAKTAFAALGIEVTDAQGRIRAADAVMADVAEAFSHLEDGTTKTALSMILFGKTGAELIPMLNEGKTGFANWTAESDRMGLTLNTKTTKAAERFNDNLTRLDGVVEGLSNRVMEAAIPSLVNLTDKLADPDFQNAAANVAKSFIDIANAIAWAVTMGYEFSKWMPKVTIVTNERDILENRLKRLNDEAINTSNTIEKMRRAMTSAGTDYSLTSEYGAQIKSLEEAQAQNLAEKIRVMDRMKILKESTTETLPPWTPPTVPTIPGLDLSQFGAGSGTSLSDEGAQVFEATRNVAEKYSAEMAKLNKLYDLGAISGDTYNRAVIQAQNALAAATEGADGYSQALSGLTDMAESFVIDGLDKIAEALGTGGDLWGAFAQAGIDALQSIGKELISSGVSNFFDGLKLGGTSTSQPIDLMDTGGNSITDFFASLFGFAEGGYGVVDPTGIGGCDSNLKLPTR